MQDPQIRYRHHREVRVRDLFTRFYLPLIIFLVLLTFLLIAILLLKNWVIIVISAAVLLIYSIVSIKTFFIGCVLAYKSYAPMEVRNRCRFEPSCSTYMILAVEKYGLIKGFIKGVKRIQRCHAPNSGIDYP